MNEVLPIACNANEFECVIEVVGKMFEARAMPGRGKSA